MTEKSKRNDNVNKKPFGDVLLKDVRRGAAWVREGGLGDSMAAIRGKSRNAVVNLKNGIPIQNGALLNLLNGIRHGIRDPDSPFRQVGRNFGYEVDIISRASVLHTQTCDNI